MQAPAAICILDGPDLVYELVNPDYRQLFPGRQLLGRRIVEALPEIADHAVYATFRHVYQTGITHAEHGLLIPLARPEDGTMEDRYFNYIQQARYNEAGNIDGVLVFAFEVTQQVMARKQAERSEQQAQALAGELAAANEEIQASNEELAEANGQLVRTNVDLDNFIYTASHDLKAPISNIEGLLGALIRSLSPQSLASERVQGITARMQNSVERFKKTIASLTEIVRLQKENNQPATQVNLAEVLGEVLLDLEPVIRSAGAKVDTDVANCRAVRFSEKNLRSVLYNLLSNAVKYRSPERPARVQVECRSTADCHVLTVTDNGLGMTASQLEKLFTMFKRFHAHVEGSGIGLYMIRKMVENAGGRIEVESRVGEGTVFTVFFPR
jgi:signal transduction histidine kinase